MWYNENLYSPQNQIDLFFFFGKLLGPRKKKRYPAQHIFFTNNSVMHLEWHMVSIFFGGLQFVFTLHINNHILSDQKCTYPPYDAFSKS